MLRRCGRAGLVIHGLYFLMIFASFAMGFVFVVYQYSVAENVKAAVIMKAAERSTASTVKSSPDPCESYLGLMENDMDSLRKAMWVLGIALFGMFAKDVFVAGIWIKEGKSRYDNPYER